jgi:hypothetical protein
MPSPRRTDYSGQCLTHHDFRDQNLAACSFNNADLTGANFANADLRFASMVGADCTMANFAGADMRCVRFRQANLTRAFMRGAWLDGTDFTGSQGLKTNAEMMHDNHRWCSKHNGFIVWRSEVCQFQGHWGYLRPGRELRERVNPDRCSFDGCGVSFGSASLIALHFKPPYWKCVITPAWLPDVVIPYNTDGRGRCSWLRLLERVDEVSP